jgi:hypothetical protein
MAGKSITIAELLVKIGVDGSDAKKAADGVGTSLGETKKKAEVLKGGMVSLGKAFAKFAAVVAGAATAVFSFVNSVAKVGDEIGKTSKKIGAGVEELQRLRFAADRSGASARNLDLAIKNQAKALQDASKGGAKLFTDALDDLGLSIADVNKLTAEERLGLFGDKLKEVEDKGKRTALAMNLFGARAGPELLPLLLEGSAGIRALGDEAEALGIVMSEDAVASSEGFVDSVTNLQAALSGVKNIIGTDLIPVVQELVEGFTKWVSTNRDVLRQRVRSFLEGIVRVAKKLIPVVETMAEIFLFLVNNLDKLLFILGGVKLAQAFIAVAAGLNAMGIAATTALGPIGIIAGALLALIPIAISVGEAVGGALSKGRQGSGTGAPRGVPGSLGAEFGEGTLEAAQAGTLQDEIQREVSLQDRLAGENRGDSQTAKQSRARMRKANAQLEKVRRTAAAKKKVRDAEAVKAAEVASADAVEGEEFGTFDADVASVRKALGIGDGPVSAKKQAKLDKAFEALAEGKSLQAARKAAGLDRRRGGGRGKGKKEAPEAAAPKVTSVTSLSEFFGAAGRGELGPIAARTPSTKDIEPTVAIDITNNNFKFDVKQTITGTSSAADTAKEVAKAIRVEFQTRLASAGQQLATNVVR